MSELKNSSKKGTAVNSSSKKSIPALYGQFYMSQGFTADNIVSNDCGPTCLAVMLNILLLKENFPNFSLRKENIIHQSRFPFWDRLPSSIPKIGGATAPWGMVSVFNQWAAKMNLPWKAERISQASRHDIITNILSGNYISALKIWKNSGAHWVNIIDFSAEEDAFFLLDPNPYLVHLPQHRRVQKESWGKFAPDWQRRKSWAYLLGIDREIILYSPKP